MGHPVDGDITSGIPDLFCWTKYGTEAGEDPTVILARKEAERRANDGVFLWGIGNAIGPSVEALLEYTALPQILFTPMLSKPAARDVAPPRVAVWHAGIGLDGSHYEIPAGSHVTSRVSPGGRAHYALVCRSSRPLVERSSSPSFASTHVQNLRSGSRVGASQVTAVVRRIACALGLIQSSYRVSFTADLVAPYLVRLTDHTFGSANVPQGVGVQSSAHQPGAWARGDSPIFV